MRDPDSPPVYDGPSRSQLKREATELQELGVELLSLPVAAMSQFTLPIEVLEAMEVARGIKRTNRGALKRAHQRVGAMMRGDVDLVVLKDELRRFRARKDKPPTADQWADRILEDPRELQLVKTRCELSDEQVETLTRHLGGATTAAKKKHARKRLLASLKSMGVG